MRNAEKLRIHVFHTLQDSSHLLCELLEANDNFEFTPYSSELFSRMTAVREAPDAWLIDVPSLPSWREHDTHIQQSGNLPTIGAMDVAVWPEGLARQFNVNDLIHIDLTRPPSMLRNKITHVVRNVTVTSTRGMTPTCEFDRDAALTVVTRDDETNRRILVLLSHGLSDKHISSSISMSTQTVRNRISRMLHDGGFDNRTSLALFFTKVTREQLHRSMNPADSGLNRITFR